MKHQQLPAVKRCAGSVVDTAGVYRFALDDLAPNMTYVYGVACAGCAQRRMDARSAQSDRANGPGDARLTL